jgi:alanyl aminopeptidase
MACTVLNVAAAQGEQELFDLYLVEAIKATERRDRGKLLSAMGSFRNPTIEKQALAIFLTDEFDAREAIALLFADLEDETSRLIVYAFVEQNFDVIVTKFPRDSGAYLPFEGWAFCAEAHWADVEAFFKDRAPNFTGGPRNLAHRRSRGSVCGPSRRPHRSPMWLHSSWDTEGPQSRGSKTPQESARAFARALSLARSHGHRNGALPLRPR